MNLYLAIVDLNDKETYNVFSSYELANAHLDSVVNQLAAEEADLTGSSLLKNLGWEQAIIATDYDMYFEIINLTLDTPE